MWTFQSPLHVLAKRVLRRPACELTSVAVRSWELAPGETTITPPALFLPNQLERVTRWEFSTQHPAAVMQGGITVHHRPARAFLLEDACLIDGAIYKGRACQHLAPRPSRMPRVRADRELDNAAVYCTFVGNRYFGNWLTDSCVTYPLAAAEGEPITLTQPFAGHMPDYEALFGMHPTRLDAARLRRAIIFDDVGQNQGKRQRWRGLGQKLLNQVNVKPHPGVFLTRGQHGQRRVLVNEAEVAQRLRDRRGFRVIDPEATDLRGILTACAGARIVAGVEGSQLIHGLILLGAGRGLFTIQPPNRFLSALKDFTDRDQQHFGFVVGTPDGQDFRADAEEIERTLDMFPASRC